MTPVSYLGLEGATERAQNTGVETLRWGIVI